METQLISRFFTTAGTDPCDRVEWTKRDAEIKEYATGVVIFEQKGMDFPAPWSQTAVNVVAQKYFKGKLGMPERETSVRQMIGRVVNQITAWGEADGYFTEPGQLEIFRDELTFLLLNQYGSFNSPVWFNVGVPNTNGAWCWNPAKKKAVQVKDDQHKPQISACFILSIEDTMEDILEQAVREGMIFTNGSGCGTNLSTLRGSMEYLSGGGKASGPVSFMRGFDAFASVIKSGGRSRRSAKMVILNADHPDIEEFIWCKAKQEKIARDLIKIGYSDKFDTSGGAYDIIQFQNANNSVRVTDEFMRAVEKDGNWDLKAVKGGFTIKSVRARDLLRQMADAAWQSGDPGMQFDTTINDWNVCADTERVVASNPCGEYSFLSDSACNLASLNLVRFLRNGVFDAMAFREAVNVFTIAQEILVDNGGYPTEKIATRSHAYRPLGLGYANLGALLMAMGLPYDSEAGRNEAAKITALMTGQAYLTSTFLAERTGPFLHWDKNRKSALRVLLKHEGEARKFNGEIAELWSQVITRAEAFGLRHAQTTLLAPTGTISFMMDCDTTGVEPDIGLVKYKSLVGGGTLKLVNQSIAPALAALGYDPESSAKIVKYIEDNGVAEGAPGLKSEHLPVFDTSLPSGPNRRSIHYRGHIKMMAAVQPFLSGAISKCITGDTLVFTDSGIVPIKHFYNNEAADQLTPTSVTLATETGPEQADQFYYGGVRPTIRLTLSDGRTIEGTPNHRIKVGNAEGYDWKRLDEITTNDYAAIKLGANIWSIHDADLSSFVPSLPYGCQKTITIPTRMSPDLARFIGCYMADGNMNTSNWSVVITKSDQSVLSRLSELSQTLFGIRGTIKIDNRNHVSSLCINSKTLVEFLTYLGCSGTAPHKRIPWSVLQSTGRSVREFVGGLWLDGYVIRQNWATAITLASRTLIGQLQVVLNNFGIRGNINSKHNKKYGRDYYCLTITNSGVVHFGELFTLDQENKAALLQHAVDVNAEKPTYLSDVVPCFRAVAQQTICERSLTQDWRELMNPRTTNMSWMTARRAYRELGVQQLGQVINNNIHFSQVEEIEHGQADVFDFHVPATHAFLGNSIVNHNTVNMPNESTVDDIMAAYQEAWELGLKSIAIYRDGSKGSQPVSTSEEVDKKSVPAGTQRKLVGDRPAVVHEFRLNGHKGFLTVGLYEDGAPGEIFVDISKEGSTISGLMDTIAILTSFCLQYGVPLRKLVQKFEFMKFEPAGFTPIEEIRYAHSLPDYIFRWLGLKFLPKESEQPREGISAQVLSPAGTDTPMCPECGSPTVRSGSCHKCTVCGGTTGCS